MRNGESRTIGLGDAIARPQRRPEKGVALLGPAQSCIMHYSTVL